MAFSPVAGVSDTADNLKLTGQVVNSAAQLRRSQLLLSDAECCPFKYKER